jgi:hypothetical protein
MDNFSFTYLFSKIKFIDMALNSNIKFIHETVETKVFLNFLLVDGRIRFWIQIRFRTNNYGPVSWLLKKLTDPGSGSVTLLFKLA